MLPILLAVPCLLGPFLLAPQEAPPGNVRVIDSMTGEPVVGAVVHGVRESGIPVWGEFWDTVRASTGADGWASLPPRDDQTPYQWRIVRAPGYAPSGSMQVPRAGVEPAVVELVPAEVARIRILDPFGRPLPLVHLGFCVGCGHTPDVLTAVTDGDGRASLPCVGRGERDIADIYPVRDGVLTDYLHIDWDAAIESEYVAVIEAGSTVFGRLLDAEGRPLAGHGVGYPRRHRGPWARTDAEGRFRLHGAPAGHCSYLSVVDPTGKAIGGFGGSRIGVERTLRMPVEEWRDERSGPTVEVSFEFVVDGEGDLPPVPVEVWDPTTGWAELDDRTTGEPTKMELAPGRYRAEIGGKGSPYASVLLPEFEVSAGEPAPAIRREIPAPRVVRLVVPDVGDATRVGVATAHAEAQYLDFDEILEDEAAGTRAGVVSAFSVPAERFALHLRSAEPGRGVDVLRVRDGGDVLEAMR
ncbi:MAG: hypothetical protein AAF726_21880 [Planctomycetota bacterium]